MAVGYFLVPAFLANQICRESQAKQCFLKLSAFFTSETSYVFSITFITTSTRFYPLNGRAVWSQVCTSLLLAILCGKINYKACSSDPLWILTLSQKQFSLGGYQEEVKGLPIKQTYITEKGQKTGKHSNMGPSQSCSFSFTHGRLPKVSDVFGYLSFWKPLEKHLPVHVIIIDPTVIHIVERYVVCTYIQVKTFSFGKASLPLPVQASCVSCQHHLHRE